MLHCALPENKIIYTFPMERSMEIPRGREGGGEGSATKNAFSWGGGAWIFPGMNALIVWYFVPLSD